MTDANKLAALIGEAAGMFAALPDQNTWAWRRMALVGHANWLLQHSSQDTDDMARAIRWYIGPVSHTVWLFKAVLREHS